MRLVPGAGYGAEDDARLLRELRARLGDAVAIDIERVADLPLSSSGKLKFVVSRLPGKRVSDLGHPRGDPA